MKKQFKLGVIGCGQNAVSVLRGVVLSDFIKEKKIIVSDKDENALDSINYLGVRTTLDYAFVAQNSEFLLIAVNSKDFVEVCKELSDIRPEKIISVMDGLTKSEIKNAFGLGVIKVARCTMDLPCSIGSGVIAIDMSDFNKSTDDTDFISNVFGNLGTVVSVEENKLNSISAVCGNSVYGLMLADSLISAGEKQGLTKHEAKIVAAQSLLGTAELIQREDCTVDELVMQACKNGNFAIGAIKSLQDNCFNRIVSEAVEACILRLVGSK
ncbi:MAG: NAD(P)-binding domain-containing protein [Clostridia bacterium]|nr:NAD(P)-binding domain-containing protein [Clostridia bacterium]